MSHSDHGAAAIRCSFPDEDVGGDLAGQLEAAVDAVDLRRARRSPALLKVAVAPGMTPACLS